MMEKEKRLREWLQIPPHHICRVLTLKDNKSPMSGHAHWSIQYTCLRMSCISIDTLQEKQNETWGIFSWISSMLNVCCEVFSCPSPNFGRTNPGTITVGWVGVHTVDGFIHREPLTGCPFKPHLTDESDWLLAHGMGVTNVGFDDLSERLFHPLERRAKKIPSKDIIKLTWG